MDEPAYEAEAVGQKKKRRKKTAQRCRGGAAICGQLKGHEPIMCDALAAGTWYF